MIKSPLNYTGGKYKLLSQITPFFPKEIDTFVDLFCGGCNVGINVKANQVIFNDNLLYLIDLYKEFQKGYEYVLQHVQSRIETFKLSDTNETGYNELRKHYNAEKNPLDLFVLICYSFNHQIRFNNKHQFNTSFGKHKGSFNKSIDKNLFDFTQKLSEGNYSFTCFDFNDFPIENLNENDFVYIDSPYLISTGSYNDGKRGFKGWTEKEEVELHNLMIKLNDKGVKFAASNVITHKGMTNQLLKDFIDNNGLNCNFLDFNYNNSNYQASNEKHLTLEVLITNYK